MVLSRCMAMRTAVNARTGRAGAADPPRGRRPPNDCDRPAAEGFRAEGAQGAIITTISFETAPGPLALAARTRTKYVPRGTPVVENVVSVEPVLKFARFDSPELDPASMM